VGGIRFTGPPVYDPGGGAADRPYCARLRYTHGHLVAVTCVCYSGHLAGHETNYRLLMPINAQLVGPNPAAVGIRLDQCGVHYRVWPLAEQVLVIRRPQSPDTLSIPAAVIVTPGSLSKAVQTTRAATGSHSCIVT
jgi:hypothetical protein